MSTDPAHDRVDPSPLPPSYTYITTNSLPTTTQAAKGKFHSVRDAFWGSPLGLGLKVCKPTSQEDAIPNISTEADIEAHDAQPQPVSVVTSEWLTYSYDRSSSRIYFIYISHAVLTRPQGEVRPVSHCSVEIRCPSPEEHRHSKNDTIILPNQARIILSFWDFTDILLN